MDTVHPTRRGGMLTDAPTHQRRVAATERSEVDGSLQESRHAPSTSPFGFTGCHPTVLQAPLGRHPDRRAEGPERRDPFKQHFHKAPDANPQHPFRLRVNVDLSTKRSTPSRNNISGVAARR